MSLTNFVLEAARQLFKTRPTLEEFIQSENPTDLRHVEFLEKQYDILIKKKALWDC
jgi:hypothetical protein